MHITSRSHLTAGIAALGVGAIALAPIQPMSTIDQDRVTRGLAVALSAESTPIDPITPWVDTFETSIANIGKLLNFYASNPGGYTSPLGLEGDFQAVFPLTQTIIANQITYFEELFNGNAGLIPGQIWNNVQTFFNAPWSPGDPPGTYVSETALATPLGLSQQTIFTLLPAVLGYTPEEWAASPLKPVVDFTSTYYSGQLVGLIGPLFAPLVELTRSFTAIAGYFEAGDVTGAINELINIPANVTNAVLNGGGVLDLTGVVNAIQPLPKEVKSIGLNLGGLISPPVPQDGSLLPNGTAPTQFNGGVLFDSLAVEIDYKVSNLPPPNGTVVNVKDPGIPVSWVGAVVGLGQYLSDEMLVTPPAPPAPPAQAAAVEGEAVEAAPVVAEVADSAPAVPDADVAEVADDAAPAVVDVPEVEAAPADVAEDPAPKPAASIGSDDAGDTGSRAGDSRRGADDAD